MAQRRRLSLSVLKVEATPHHQVMPIGTVPFDPAGSTTAPGRVAAGAARGARPSLQAKEGSKRPSSTTGIHCPRLLTLSQAGEQLSVSVRTIRRLIDGGELATHRIGRAVRISADDLARFIAGCRMP